MKNIIVLILVVFSACGTQSALESDAAAAQVAVSQLGTALAEGDSALLYDVLSPEVRARWRIEGPELKGALKDIIDQQGGGWARTLGDDAKKPRIHSVRGGYGNQLEVTLLIKGEPSEKKLYFQWVDEELKFAGIIPNPGPTVAATAITATRNFRIENFIGTAQKFSYGGDFVFGNTFCGGTATTSVPKNSSVTTSRTCTVQGADSCKVTFNSDRGGAGGNWCASWGWQSIDHQHQGGVTGCWYQWIGADMWFQPMDWHGNTFPYDARCNI